MHHPQFPIDNHHREVKFLNSFVNSFVTGIFKNKNTNTNNFKM